MLLSLFKSWGGSLQVSVIFIFALQCFKVHHISFSEFLPFFLNLIFIVVSYCGSVSGPRDWRKSGTCPALLWAPCTSCHCRAPYPYSGLWFPLIWLGVLHPLEKYPQTGLLAFWSVMDMDTVFPFPTIPASTAGWEEVQWQACSDCSKWRGFMDYLSLLQETGWHESQQKHNHPSC